MDDEDNNGSNGGGLPKSDLSHDANDIAVAKGNRGRRPRSALLNGDRAMGGATAGREFATSGRALPPVGVAADNASPVADDDGGDGVGSPKSDGSHDADRVAAAAVTGGRESATSGQAFDESCKRVEADNSTGRFRGNGTGRQ